MCSYLIQNKQIWFVLVSTPEDSNILGSETSCIRDEYSDVATLSGISLFYVKQLWGIKIVFHSVITITISLRGEHNWVQNSVSIHASISISEEEATLSVSLY